MIPVSRPYIGDEELNAVKDVFDSRWLGLGAVVKEFEDSICAFTKAPRFLATNTGTTAIHLALRALGIGKGDEVIVPSFTFVASVQAITASGAVPVFCDILEDTLNIDVEKIEALISASTKAIMPVHYRGSVCDMDKLLSIAKQYNLFIIEDAAHAIGSSYKGKMIGSFGHVTCFSFDPIKNITCGEGGGVVFQAEKYHTLAEKMRILGIDNDTWSRYQNKRAWQYDVVCEGYRYHMPNFCAAIGLQQMKKIDLMKDRKVEICKAYDIAFKSLKRIHLVEMDYSSTFPFMYIVLTDDRASFIKHLTERGIGSGIHYVPAHEFDFYRDCNQDDLQVTKKISKMNVTLPLYYEMAEDDVQKVIDAVLSYEENL